MKRILLPLFALALLVLAGCSSPVEEEQPTDEPVVHYFSAEESGLGVPMRYYDMTEEQANASLEHARALYGPTALKRLSGYTDGQPIELEEYHTWRKAREDSNFYRVNGISDDIANKLGTGWAYWEIISPGYDYLDVTTLTVTDKPGTHDDEVMACYHHVTDDPPQCTQEGCISFLADRMDAAAFRVEWDAGTSSAFYPRVNKQGNINGYNPWYKNWLPWPYGILAP